MSDLDKVAKSLHAARTPVGRPVVGAPINVRLGDDLLAAVDAEAVRLRMSRAEVIRMLLGERLAGPPQMGETAFLDAWRRGILIAGRQWFGDGVSDGATKWDLRPRYDDIVDMIGCLSSGEAAFLAAMYSFYDADRGGVLLRKMGNEGLADLAARLDGPRRQVIADLLIAYQGW